MKIINKLTLRHLWASKKRTVITLFGIIISVAMVTAVFTSVESLMNTLGEITAAYDGAWHAQYSQLTGKDVQTLTKQKNVKVVGLSMSVGNLRSKADDDSSKSQTDVLAGNRNYFSVLGIQATSGRLPSTAGELLVSKSFITRNNLDWAVGDTVTLPFTPYQNLNTADSVEMQEESRTYTICGITETDNQQTGIYSAFCGLDDTVTDATGTYLAYVQFSPLGSTTTQDIESAAKALYGASATDDDAYFTSPYCTHTDYLMYCGVTKNTEVTTALIGFVAVILLIIVFASVFMIYDSFAVSYQQRARYLGMLASVGATRIQRRGSVYFEGFILGCIGIPLGILCGIGGIAVTLRALSDSFMKTVVSGNSSVRLHAVVNWKVIVFSVIVSALTIFISAWIPAHRASKVTPIEALRQTNTVKVKKAKKLKTSRLRQKLFGFEDVLAVKNYKRNGKRSRTVVFALAVSVILFLSTANFTGMLTTAVNSEYDSMNFDVYESIFNAEGPLTANQVEKINKTVSEIPGIQNIRICTDNEMTVDGLDSQLSAEYKAQMTDNSITVLGVDNDTFAAVAKEAGIDPAACQDEKTPTGILINRVTLSTEEKQRQAICPLQGSQVGKTYTGTMSGWDSQGNDVTPSYTVKVAAQINKDAECLHASYFRPTLVVPMHSYLVNFPDVLAQGNTIDYARYYITARDHDTVYNAVSDTLDEIAGISHSGYDAAAQAQTMQALNVVVMTFGYGFITLITLISVMNIINTISSSMEERRREFAMIKSVGMTPKSFKKSIYLESIRYGVMALAWGLPVSLGLDVLMYKVLADSFDYGFTFRWYYYLAAALAVFAVIGIALLYALDKIKKDNIIETLKRDDI